MPGDLDLPYEDVPDGPLELDLSDVLLAGGVVVKAAVVPGEGGVKWPGLVFSFHLADGQMAPPIMLVLDPARMAGLVDLIGPAAAAAVREATS